MAVGMWDGQARVDQREEGVVRDRNVLGGALDAVQRKSRTGVCVFGKSI